MEALPKRAAGRLGERPVYDPLGEALEELCRMVEEREAVRTRGLWEEKRRENFRQRKHRRTAGDEKDRETAGSVFAHSLADAADPVVPTAPASRGLSGTGLFLLPYTRRRVLP